MDNTVVSARVPRAKKERASGILNSLGATTSDLINSAFDYVIASKELPTSEKVTAPNTEAFQSFVSSTTLDANRPQDFDGDYKQLMMHMRASDYPGMLALRLSEAKVGGGRNESV